MEEKYYSQPYVQQNDCLPEEINVFEEHEQIEKLEKDEVEVVFVNHSSQGIAEYFANYQFSKSIFLELHYSYSYFRIGENTSNLITT